MNVGRLSCSAARARTVVVLAAVLTLGVLLGVRSGATAAPGADAQTTTTTPSQPVVSPQSDPIANAQSPFCGDQDGSELPNPPTIRCSEYTLVPNLRFMRLLGAGSVPVRFDYVFRSAAAQNGLAVYTIDDSDGSVNGVLPGEAGYSSAVASRVQTVFTGSSTPSTPDVTLSFTGGDMIAFRFGTGFYSFEAANPNGIDHLLAYRHTVGGWGQVAWEDGSLGDADFDDMAVNVHAPASALALPPGQSIGVCDGEGAHALSGSACQHDPVNSLTGAFVTSATDLRLPGIGVPFSWRRSYDSLNATVGRLGPGWTESYATSLLVQGNGDVLLHGDEGQQVAYTKQGDGSFLGAPGSRSVLSTVAGGYQLVRKDQVVYLFDVSGRLLSMKDRNNQGVTLSYSGSELQTITDSVGRQISVTYENGLLDRVTLPDGRYVEYGYLNGRLSSVRDARGNTTQYTYDAGGRLKTVVDQNGHTVVDNTYGADGRVTQQTSPHGTGAFTWDPATQTATYTDARQNEWKDVYRDNLLAKRIDPLANTWRYEYDGDVNVRKLTDARGSSTTMTYDARGNMLTRTSPLPFSYQEIWTYTARNDPLTYRDRRENTTDFGYDTAGNLTSVTRPDADGPGPLERPQTLFGRDPQGTGLLTSLRDPRGKTTTFSYLNGNLSEIQTQLGNRTTLCYDPSGRLIGLIDPRGPQTCGGFPNPYRWQYTSNATDQLETQTDPLGHVSELAYDPAGNLESRTDANGHETVYGYDEANGLTSVTAPDPDGAGPLAAPVTSYAYDDVGNLESRTDANAHVTGYAYDDADRLERVTAPDTRIWTYAYDPNGNVKEVVDANGNSTPATGDGKTTYAYDTIDRLKSIDYSDSTPDVTFAYDGNDNRTQLTDGSGTETSVYDPLDRLTSVTRGSTAISFGYDLLNLTSRTYPGVPVTSYAYDEDERLSTVSWGANVVEYGYDAAGNLQLTDLPDSTGWTEGRFYDEAGRLTGVKVGIEGAFVPEDLSLIELTLDPVGNPLTRTRSGTLPGTETYTYDAMDRLTSVCFQAGSCPGGSDPFIRWSYDGVGNRLSEARPTGTTSYSYNAADELEQAGSTSYTYDENGNQLSAGSRTFAWDLANRLRSTTLAGTTTSYSYDGEGKRLQASTGAAASQKTNFLWDASFPLPQLVQESDGAGNALRRYRHGHRPLHVTSGASVSYLHFDPLGSVVDVTAASGGALRWSYGFEPYGLTRQEQQHGSGQPLNLLKFAGEYADPTGLYHLRARQHDPASGRFLSRDPWPLPIVNPLSSRYAYVADHPTVFVDPSGLKWCDPLCDVPGDVISGAVAGVESVGAFSSRYEADVILGIGTAGCVLVAPATAGATLACAALGAGALATSITRNAVESGVVGDQPTNPCRFALSTTGTVGFNRAAHALNRHLWTERYVLGDIDRRIMRGATNFLDTGITRMGEAALGLSCSENLARAGK
jgi:RHS repeat-associated protein